MRSLIRAFVVRIYDKDYILMIVFIVVDPATTPGRRKKRAINPTLDYRVVELVVLADKGFMDRYIYGLSSKSVLSKIF